MGSSSVYCGISNIAITGGNQAVLLPLKSSKNYLRNSYLPYLPATLPIFGEYDDYGGIENIERDKNVELIEDYFDMSIEDFCRFFTYPFRDRDPELSKHFPKGEFMWIDRKVYDFMSSKGLGYYGAGHFDFGNPVILNLLGFKYNGINCDNNTQQPNRYKHEWEKQGKLFYSDNTWLHADDSGIYNFNGKWNSLEQYIDLEPEYFWLKEKMTCQLWSHFDKKLLYDRIFWIIGGDKHESDISDLLLESFNLYCNLIEEAEKEGDTEKIERLQKGLKNVSEKLKEKQGKNKDEISLKNLTKKYIDDYQNFGDLISQLVVLRHNLHSMSGHFKPYVQYMTPQCGERDLHDCLMEKFRQINRSYIDESIEDHLMEYQYPFGIERVNEREFKILQEYWNVDGDDNTWHS